jgi:hypothetical protein
MPHLHVLLFTDLGDTSMAREYVDNYISARVPPMVDIMNLSAEAFQQMRLRMTVGNSMLHDCNEQCGGLGDNTAGKKTRCNKHFPKAFSRKTELSGFYDGTYIILLHL